MAVAKEKGGRLKVECAPPDTGSKGGPLERSRFRLASLP